MNKIDQ